MIMILRLVHFSGTTHIAYWLWKLLGMLYSHLPLKVTQNFLFLLCEGEKGVKIFSVLEYKFSSSLSGLV